MYFSIAILKNVFMEKIFEDKDTTFGGKSIKKTLPISEWDFIYVILYLIIYLFINS